MHSEPWQGIKRSNQQLPKHHKYDSTECPLYDLLAIYSINQRGLKSQHRHWVQHPFPPIQPPLQINQKDLRRKENEIVWGMNEAGQNKKMSLQRSLNQLRFLCRISIMSVQSSKTFQRFGSLTSSKPILSWGLGGVKRNSEGFMLWSTARKVILIAIKQTSDNYTLEPNKMQIKAVINKGWKYKV